MTIKQYGGVFGRNPTFNDVTIESDLNIGDKLGVNIGTDTPTTYVEVRTDGATGDDDFVNLTRLTYGNVLSLSRSSGDAVIKSDKNLILRCDSGNNQTGANTNIIFQYDGSTESARFNSAGNLAFTSGNGIDFSATAGTGSTSELLDDYEEGAWTPTITGSTGGAASFTISTSSYTKIGDTVRLSCYLSGADVTGLSGNVRLGGFPFPASGYHFCVSGYCTFFGFDESDISVGLYTESGQSFSNFLRGSSTVSITAADATTSSGGTIMFNLTYKTT
tara:strand:+ start:1441 stop:2268 length:828 start_codon:yes stop_codon:yes gene_type:complete